MFNARPAAISRPGFFYCSPAPMPVLRHNLLPYDEPACQGNKIIFRLSVMRIFTKIFCCLLLATPPYTLYAEDGYRLWLRFDKIKDAGIRMEYNRQLKNFTSAGQSPTIKIAIDELKNGLEGLLGHSVPMVKTIGATGSIILATSEHSPVKLPKAINNQLQQLDKEGFILQKVSSGGKSFILIGGGSDIGVLYGVFHFLRLLQTQQSITRLQIKSEPDIPLRMLNHWDNLDRTVERGYAGASIWDWHRLPEYLDRRYTDYARANASIGINATVLTNVNANALVLRPDYLEKTRALADLFRPYGIRVFLTARFSAPIELGGLKTADPHDPQVQAWWKNKVDEIYRLIPDFGGFVVKANSEGQPGPQNYGRTHADGANLLANALQPYSGRVIWRAFVYSNETPEDRVRQAFSEFVPLDGSFSKNVMIQVKNGPLDFQPREPVHPLLLEGALTQTASVLELQITQEYLGQANHLVFLAPMWQEVLETPDFHQKIDGFAGVSNIGSDRNWTGHLFGQTNWYAFGRLSWDNQLSPEAIADEWTRMTFSNDNESVKLIKSMLLNSLENCVDYMTPLGLAHLMATGHHFGPGPWVNDLPRADWNPTYFHRADSTGIGFNRTATGSNAVAQYPAALRDLYASRAKCPEKFLLWFHHVGWNEKLASGRTLWEEICRHYDQGVIGAVTMQADWQKLKKSIDSDRFEQVEQLLSIQAKEARWWHDACLSYFQSVSKLPYPAGTAPPEKSLEYYKKLDYPFAPGIRPRW